MYENLLFVTVFVGQSYCVCFLHVDALWMWTAGHYCQTLVSKGMRAVKECCSIIILLLC